MSSPIDKALGRRVRVIRERLGYTVQQLAEKAGMSHPQLSRLESGTRTWNYSKAEEVATALGVSLHLLQDESIPLGRLAEIAEVMNSISDLSDEQLDAVLSLLRAMR